MTISQEKKIEREHPSLQIAIDNWMDAQFPLAHKKNDAIAMRMASAALEVLKLAFSNTGLEAE